MNAVSPLGRPLAAAVAEFTYTLCPVLVASNVALELGWIDDELARVGARALHLRSRPDDGTWNLHFTHDSDRLVRDGGNSPAIWAHADIRRTVLVGLTQAQPAGKVLVRAGSDLFRVGDLKGRRIGIYRSANNAKIDHRRATTERGILNVLAVHGLTRHDLDWVDIADTDRHDEQPAPTPAGIWAQKRYFNESGSYLTNEAKALADGRIDALFDYSVGVAETLERTGQFKVIEDLDRHPDWTLRNANSPRTLVFSREFAEANRDAVVAWTRAAIRAGRWINANPQAAGAIFRRSTYYPDAAEIARALRHYDLVPNLSPQNLAGLRLQKDFLRKHGYVSNDFTVEDWADPSILAEAHAGL
ncbi:ABC transporter substrate-binding protein [Zavarzinia sp. CC-PAN008]|uniref:ABC transporter substrate-binding protein n=1 Tax=Zavarzinia sp. CC-PAN008 TaxID=3243332 RepID=UPI003F74A61D